MLDKLLYLYATGFISLLVIASALNFTQGPSNLVIGVLFAPVALYLIFSLIWRLKNRPQKPQIQKYNSPLTQILNQADNQTTHANQPKSFIVSFFSQRQPLFLITLSLFIIAFTTSLARTTLEYSHHQQLVHPLSNSHQTK